MTTIPPYVSPLLLISPVNTEVNTIMPTFIWTPVQGADRYSIWVSTYSTPEDDPHYQDETTLTHAIYPSWARPLSFGRRYYWRVQALYTPDAPAGGPGGKSKIAYFIPWAYTSELSLEEVAKIISEILSRRIRAQLEDYELIKIRSEPPGEEEEIIQGIRDGTAAVSSATLESLLEGGR